VKQALDEHIEKHTDMMDVEARMRFGDGSYCWMLIRARAMYDDDGPYRVVCVSTIIIYICTSMDR